MKIEIPEAIQLAEELAGVKAELSALRERIQPARAWYDLQSAARLKGVCAGTLRARPWLQPRAGVEDGRLNGKRCWKAETVRQWCDMTHDEIQALAEGRKS